MIETLITILLVLITSFVIYKAGISTGKTKVRAEILDFLNATIENDIEISQQILKFQAEFNSKKKPTKEEKEEYEKCKNTFHILLGRAELYEELNQDIISNF